MMMMVKKCLSVFNGLCASALLSLPNINKMNWRTSTHFVSVTLVVFDVNLDVDHIKVSASLSSVLWRMFERNYASGVQP